MSFKVRDVRKSLKKKGFTETVDGHHIYLHLWHEGKAVGPYTLASHGADAEDVGDNNVTKMKMQLGLKSTRQVNELIECSMSHTAYIELLKASGKI